MTTATETVTVELDGRTVRVAVRHSRRARRLALRIHPGRGAEVVVPEGVDTRLAGAFVARHRDWLAHRLARVAVESLDLVPGAAVPIQGVPHRIVLDGAARRGVWIEAGAVRVSGHPEHVARRVTDFLKTMALRLARGHVARLAPRLGRTPRSVAVRDTRTRWGSCSATGALSLSWRLAMAPDFVLAYVVAHEMAHLVEMNHSPAFWRVVAELVADPEPAKRWLAGNGAGLHRYR